MTIAEAGAPMSREVTVRMTERAAAGVYSNGAFLNASTTEITLDFVVAVAEMAPQLQSRVFVSHAVAYALFEALGAIFHPNPSAPPASAPR